MLIPKSSQQLKELSLNKKGFRSKTKLCSMDPFSEDYLKIKHTAYQKHYPMGEDKENVYQLSKTPHLGYYLMKGFKPHQNTQSITQSSINHRPAQASQKIINHFLKKYFQRKSKLTCKQKSSFPIISNENIKPINSRCLEPKSKMSLLYRKRTKTEHSESVADDKKNRYIVSEVLE